jgi:hypothetical protein
MATSPNFGWLEPDNTDLVKNGALAIRTLGDAIDASLVDLKGGTTGQVLAKASNTDMDFVWAADAGAPTSLGYAAGKNRIINGDFTINQRNFTTTSSNSIYGFDRWRSVFSGGTYTYSAQTFTPGTAPVAGYEGTNFARITTSGQSGTSDYASFAQSIEDVRSFAGQTVTLSFWAKASSGTPSVAAAFEQRFGSGGSPSSNVVTHINKAAVTTSWARYSMTIAVPSLSGKTIGTTANTSDLTLYLFTSGGSGLNAYVNGLGIQNTTIDFWGVQIEAGSVATAFQTATGTIQGELAACQRYFWQIATGNNNAIGTGFYNSGTELDCVFPAPVPMRTAPTLIQTTGTNYYAFGRNGGTDNFNSVTLATAQTTATVIFFFNSTDASGTAGQAGYIQTSNASASLAASAEL